jgi:hypothetical protein
MTQSPDSEDDYAFSKYFSHYGGFAAYWLYYEHIIEILIKRELRLDTREASLLCCAMAFGVKLNVLKALLRRKSENQPSLTFLVRFSRRPNATASSMDF